MTYQQELLKNLYTAIARKSQGALIVGFASLDALGGAFEYLTREVAHLDKQSLDFAIVTISYFHFPVYGRVQA